MGTEITAALNTRAKKTGFKVAQLFPEPGIMSLNVPAYLSDYATRKLREDGVDVHTKVFIKKFEVNDQKALTDQTESNTEEAKEHTPKFTLTLSNDDTIKTDHVGKYRLFSSMRHSYIIIQLWLLVSSLTLNWPSLLASKSTRTTEVLWSIKNWRLALISTWYVFPLVLSCCYNINIYQHKAGDVVSYYDPILGRRRVEHYDHADNSGRHAALNMTGARKAYNYMPMFWGAMNGTPYEAVGLIDSRLDTVGVWQKGALFLIETFALAKHVNDHSIGEDENSAQHEEQGEYKKGVVYYLKEKKVVGVLLWNLFNRVDDARRAIRIGREFDDMEKLQRVITLDDKAKEDEDRRMQELNDRDTQQDKKFKKEE